MKFVSYKNNKRGSKQRRRREEKLGRNRDRKNVSEKHKKDRKG